MKREWEQAVDVLKSGGVVVFPTETAYGLAADATNARAVERVSHIKGREGWKTPPLIVASFEMAEEYVEITSGLRTVVEKYWPGPLTIVGKAKQSHLAHQVVRDDDTIAIRVSSHPVAQVLSEKLGGPIVATSANVSGKPECYSVQDVIAQFDQQLDQPDFCINEGVLKPEPPSTIIKEENGSFIVLRQGSINLN